MVQGPITTGLCHGRKELAHGAVTDWEEGKLWARVSQPSSLWEPICFQSPYGSVRRGKRLGKQVGGLTLN
jgi:hypothetical protein